MLLVWPVLVSDGTDEVTVLVWLLLVAWVIALVGPDGVDKVEAPVWLTLVLWLVPVLCDSTDEVTVVVWLMLGLVLSTLLTCVDPNNLVVVLWPMLLVCDGREVIVTEVA